MSIHNSIDAFNNELMTSSKRKRNRSLRPENEFTMKIKSKQHLQIDASNLNFSTKVTPNSNIEKQNAKKVGSRLKNLLKLPKAHKMCVYEWFYSNVDNSLFNSDNDFCMCLKDSFPELKTYKLTRTHWAKIRRLMGKPRRCSEAFFHEERLALANKRHKIRLLQKNKIPKEDQDTWSLPREIPLPLVVGTNVTAWLRTPNDGLFTGQIDAIDAANSAYRVTFDRANLGTHMVPDIEVCSFEPQDTINIISLIDQQTNLAAHVPQRFIFPVCVSNENTQPENDPVLGYSPLRNKLQLSDEQGGTLQGFPVQLLKKVARLSRVLTTKREKVYHLSSMNCEAEKANSFGEDLSLEFQRKYATIVVDLERLNKDLNELLVGVQRFCLELYPEQILPIDETNHLRRQCDNMAKNLITSKSSEVPRVPISNSNLTNLVTNLTSLMFQIKTLSQSNQSSSIEFKSLTDTLKDIKKKLDSKNQVTFQRNIEIHIAHIKSCMETEKIFNSMTSSSSNV